MSEGFQALSEREKETLRLLLGGHDIKSIASGLGLSVHTVNERLREARRKLGASSSRQAARLLAEAEQGGPNFQANFSGLPHLSGDRESGVAGPAIPAANHGRSYRTPGRGQSIAWLSGGMLIMSLIIAAAVVSLVLHGGDKAALPALTKIASAAPSASESAGAARAWLALVDGYHWNESWSAAGAVLQSHISAADFQAQVQPLRQQLGAVSSRTLETVNKATSLPGVPDGQYEILQFATSFANKAASIETVTLAHEPSGWKVDGYFVK